MKRSEIILMALQVPLDYIALILAAVSAYNLRFTQWAIGVKPVFFNLSLSSFLSIVALVAFGWIVIFAFLGIYSANPNRKLAKDLNRVMMGSLIGLSAVAVYVMFSQKLFESRFLILLSWFLAMIYIIFFRILMRGIKGLLYRWGIGLRKVAVIGSEKLKNEIVYTLQKRKELGYKVVGNYEKFSEGVAREIKNLSIEEIIFINPKANEQETIKAIDFCNEYHITFKYSADLFSVYSTNMSISPLAGVPIVELKRTPLDGWGSVAKRFFDIIISLISLVITSPVMLLSALIILIETGRPVIYKNERVCALGKKFFAYKFRSMYQKDCTGEQFGKDGEKATVRERELIKKLSIKDGPIYKIANDPRITPVGKFIRRWSIDELPQLFNVLKGEMSVVGPRPHQPREVEKYNKNHYQVFSLKPGITGLAQISGRSELPFEEEMRLDIFYVEKWSLFLDLIILIKTPFVVFKRKGVL